MNRRYHSLTLISFILVALISCGGGTGGAPGSDSGDTGIMIKFANLSITSPDIDTYQNPTACSGKPEQPLTAARATMNVETENLTPNITSAHFPASVEECTITYLKANEDPASPIIEKQTIYPNCKLAVGTNTCDVILLDIARKHQYADAVIVNPTHAPAEYPTHYLAQYTCKYISNFGKTGYFHAEIDIWLADWLSC